MFNKKGKKRTTHERARMTPRFTTMRSVQSTCSPGKSSFHNKFTEVIEAQAQEFTSQSSFQRAGKVNANGFFFLDNGSKIQL
jgi:hypothetical protein